MSGTEFFGDRRWADVGKNCTFDSPTYSVPRDSLDSLPLSQWGDSFYGTRPAIAQRIPGGWGGFAVHYKGGWTTIYLVDTTKAQAAIRQLIAEGAQGISPDVRIREGRWTYIQLYEWNRFIWSHMRGIEITGYSFDESENRLIYSLVDLPGLRRFEQRLADLNVPCWLVEDEAIGRFYLLSRH